MKPNSLSTKEWLIKKLSLDLVVSEKIINAVITHQFDSTNNALLENNTVELYNFGKFYFNVKKAKKELFKFENTKKVLDKILVDENSLENDLRKAKLKLIDVNKNITLLKSKINEDV